MAEFQSVWAISTAIAVSVYGILAWFGEYHLNQKAKNELSKWLLGEYKDTWQRHYSAFFDAVFGKKHVSLVCFFRSSIASVVAVTAIYFVIVDEQGFMGGRIADDPKLLELILLAIVINFIPDYLSLFETRLLIGLFQKYRSLPTQFGLLVADLVASGAIIFIFISVYRAATGQPPIALVEMVGFFSVYSIFFYSTFLTSIWAWLFVLASMTLKLFYYFRLHKFLDLRHRATHQVSLVTALYAFALTLIVAPVTARDDVLRTTKVDQWLCNFAPSAACPHVLRLSDNDQEKLVIQLLLCERESGENCAAAAASFRSGQEPQRAIELFQQACDLENAEGCLGAAEIFVASRNTNWDEQISLAAKACNMGNGRGCALEAVLVYQEAVSPTDEDYALARLEAGCKLSSTAACTSLGWMIENGWAAPTYSFNARDLFFQACEQGEALACFLMGRSMENGDRFEANIEDALVWYQEACKLESARGCAALDRLNATKETELGANYSRVFTPWEVCGTISPRACTKAGEKLIEIGNVYQDADRAAALFAFACENNDASGCFHHARALQLGRGVAPDTAAAKQFFDKACGLGDMEACAETKILSELEFDYFVSYGARKHLDYVMALCVIQDIELCSQLERFERNPAFPLAENYTKELCDIRGENICQADRFMVFDTRRNLLP
ncbi:MAG: tetratricopeptide repeat protein [Pseudoruegeria sp.]